MFNFYTSKDVNKVYYDLEDNLNSINPTFFLNDCYSDLIRQIDSDNSSFLLYNNDLDQLNEFILKLDTFYYIFADINKNDFQYPNCKIITSDTYKDYFNEIFKNKVFQLDSKSTIHELIMFFFKLLVSKSSFIYIKGAYFLDKFQSLNNNKNNKYISIFNLIIENNKDLTFLFMYLGTNKDWESKDSFSEKLNNIKIEFERKFSFIKSKNKSLNIFFNQEFLDRVIITDKYYIRVAHLIDYIEKKYTKNSKLDSKKYDDIAIQPLLSPEGLNSFKRLLDN